MSNLGQYIPDMRIYVGDIASTEFSDATILTALENGVMYLARRWDSQYLIFSSGIINQTIGTQYVVNVPQGTTVVENTITEGDVFRNSNVTFTSVPPPIIQENDLPAVLIAASYLLRRSKASSSTSGLSWSTPDLTYSNIQSAKTYLELMKWDLEAIELFFKQKLGYVQIGVFSRQLEVMDTVNAAQAANWWLRLAQEQRTNK